MNIIFFFNKDLYCNIFFNHLIPHLSRQDKIYIFFSTSIGTQKKRSPLLDFLRFYEQDLPNEFLFSEVGRPFFLKSKIKQPVLKTFSQLKNEYHFTMQDVTNANDPDSLSLVRAMQPDLIVSVRFGQIFKEKIIKIPKHGILNLHSGLLPEYRGILGTFWSMLLGNSEYGYTLHRVLDSTIDTGNILERKVLPINSDRSLFLHICKIYPKAAVSTLSAINILRNGQHLTDCPQEVDQGRYYTYPETKDFEAFSQKGMKIFNKDEYFEILSAYAD